MKRLVLIALVGIVLGGTAYAMPPNVILILADDLGYGDVGAYGARLIKTPHIDELAEQGVRLAEFYASSNVCSPSRAGLLTGRYAVRQGLATGTITIDDTRGLPEGATTIASLLDGENYRTGLVGKWHLGHHDDAQRPNAHGFEDFFGLLHPNDVAQPFYRNRRALGEPVEQSSLTRRFTEEAVSFVERNADVPFFLYLSHTAPHIPLVASSRFAGVSAAGAYGDVVEELDWSVGEIVQAVRRSNIVERTVILFSSDNGPFPEGSAGGLRGGKASTFDGGYRVPFIARWPGTIPAASASSAMAMNIDLLPTIAAIAGVSLPNAAQLDGRNILPVLLGAATESPHESLVFFNHDLVAAVRTQDWKIVVRADYRNIERVLPDHDVRLLFDMRQDPYENYSMAAHRPDKWREFYGLFKRAQRELEP